MDAASGVDVWSGATKHQRVDVGNGTMGGMPDRREAQYFALSLLWGNLIPPHAALGVLQPPCGRRGSGANTPSNGT